MRRGLLAAALLLAGCGLAPAYGPGGAGASLRTRVAVETPDTPDGFLLGARLEDRLGRQEGGPEEGALRLVAGLSVTEVAAAVTPKGAITRYDLEGRTPWQLLDASGRILAEGVATAFAGYSATGTTVATGASEADARGRLMTLLAGGVVTRLLSLDPEDLT